MSPKIALAALLLASAPLVGLADDSASNESDAAIEKKSEVQSEKSKRESSDITLSKEERRAEREERHNQLKELVHERSNGGRNPSQDD